MQEMEGSRGGRLSQACDHIQSGADWRDLPSVAVKVGGRRDVCGCCLSTKQKLMFCDTDDKKSDILVVWCGPQRGPPQQLERRAQSGGLGGDPRGCHCGPRATEGAGPGVASRPGPPAQCAGICQIPRDRLGLSGWQWRGVGRGDACRTSRPPGVAEFGMVAVRPPGPAERQPAGCGSGRAPSSATLPAPRLHPPNLAVVVGSSRLVRAEGARQRLERSAVSLGSRREGVDSAAARG